MNGNNVSSSDDDGDEGEGRGWDREYGQVLTNAHTGGAPAAPGMPSYGGVLD